MFLTLWVLLLLGFALWRFRLEPDVVKSPPPTPVVLAPEIRGWFDSGAVVEAQLSKYIVELKVSAAHLASPRGEATEIHLGYHFTGADSVVDQGAVPCRIKTGETSTKLELPNPKRVSAREIRLHLTH